MMDALAKLLDVAKTLLGPNGCPWDRQQTLLTLQPYVLEEAHELIEAIDSQDKQKMKEELGDLFYTIVFVANLAEKEGLFTLSEAMHEVTEKMIRRHPHIFGNEKADSADEVMQNWERIKKQEGKKTLFEGMPPTLPALARAQKVFSKLRRKGLAPSRSPEIQTEEELGERLWQLIEEAEFAGFDAESVLRRFCKRHEDKGF
jgi:MazG family protein